MVDWEAAGEEDPFIDLAAACNFFCSRSGQVAEDYFLMSYFGYELSDFERAKLYLMKQISYYFYALHFLQFAMQSGLSLSEEMHNVPSYPEWTEGFSTQKYGLNTGTDFLLLGNVFVHSSLSLLNQETFDWAKNALNPEKN